MSENKKPLTNSWLEKSHKTSESGSLHIHFNDFKIGEFETLLKKTIASNSELILFQQRQSLNLQKFTKSAANKKKESKPKKATSSKNVHLKEIISQAGDLSHLYMPIVHLAEIDPTRKKTNRLLRTFKQGVAYYKNRKSTRSESAESEKTEKCPQVRTHSVPSRPVSFTFEAKPKIFMDRYSPIISPESKTDESKCATETHSNENIAYKTNMKSMTQQRQHEANALTPSSLRSITNSIGDIIKILKTSSSASNSGSNSDNNVVYSNSNPDSNINHSHFKLYALNAEIDRTMSEISKFKNEVSSRIQRHNQNLDLTEYEKDLLNLLSPNEFVASHFHEQCKSTTDRGVNTDISMKNTLISVQTLENSHFNKNVPARRSKKQSTWAHIPHNVIINEVTASEHNRLGMAQEMFNEYAEQFASPIVETPDTSKHESPSFRNKNATHHLHRFNHSTGLSQSPLADKVQHRAKPELTSSFSNSDSLPVYKPNVINSKLAHHFRHLQNFDGVSGHRKPVSNFGEVYKRNMSREKEAEDSDVDIDDHEFDGEIFSNESSGLSENEKDSNVFKKIFTRNTYDRFEEDNRKAFEGRVTMRPISLVKLKKKDLNQRTPSSSSSGSPTSMNLFQPVSVHQQAKIINRQPLTRTPLFDFAEQQQQQALTQQMDTRKSPMYNKRRSNTYDSSQFYNYENFQKFKQENPQVYIDPYSNHKSSLRLSRSNTKHRVVLNNNSSNNKIPLFRTSSSGSTANETSSEKHSVKTAYEKSSAHMMYLASATPLQMQSSSNKIYEDPLRFMSTHNTFRQSKLNNVALDNRANRANSSYNPRRALTLFKNNEENADGQFLLSLNDFRRPHSAFQIDNPADVARSQTSVVQSEEKTSMNIIKQGDVMNKSNFSSARNRTPEIFLQNQNSLNVKRHSSLKVNKFNKPGYSENTAGMHDIPVYERPKAKRHNIPEKPLKYYIHYPMSSTTNLTSVYSTNEAISNFESISKTPDNSCMSTTIESVMLKAYKLPKKSSNSHRY